jgi:hypothetical protein
MVMFGRGLHAETGCIISTHGAVINAKAVAAGRYLLIAIGFGRRRT